MSEVPGSDPTKEPKMTPETPEQKLGRLSQALGISQIREQIDDLNKMQNRLLTELGNTNQNLNAALEWIKDFSNKVNQAESIRQQPQATPQLQPQAHPDMTSLLMADPQSKMQMIQGIAEIVKLLRGGTSEPAANGGINMQNMLMEWFARVMQASLDGMASQVYGIQMNPPKGILNSAQRVRVGNVGEHGFE